MHIPYFNGYLTPRYGIQGQIIEEKNWRRRTVFDIAENAIKKGNIRSWIFFPTKIEIFTSTDGKIYTLISSITNTFSDNLEGTFTKDFTFNKYPVYASYIKVKAENYGVCPEWHLGAGGKTWLFVDELTIK